MPTWRLNPTVSKSPTQPLSTGYYFSWHFHVPIVLEIAASFFRTLSLSALSEIPRPEVSLAHRQQR
jgi:hypothetical protein